MNLRIERRRPSVMGDPSTLDQATRARRQALPIALVTMPFVSSLRPSLQLGLLKPIAESHAFPTETFHLNLELAAMIGRPLFDLLCDHRGEATGDWLFSLAAFGDASPDPADRFIEQYRSRLEPRLAAIDSSVDELLRVRHQVVPEYLDQMEAATDWDRFRVVGFTSTFQQNVASFAFARRLKQRHPDTLILFGGANFEGEMGAEWTRSLPCIDLAIDGEADLAFSQVLRALSEGDDPLEVPGVVGRRDGQLVRAEPAPPFDRLDELPVPEYGEYFARAQALGLLDGTARRRVQLPFESARGCWWGAKRHCTFCGLNGGTMAFRTKSVDRVEVEMAELAYRYRSFDLESVDNILEPSFVDELFPRLVRAGSTYQIFYEVKADLTPAQLRTLRNGGVCKVQPGIESLSSHTLGLMRKGVRASTNVNLLRWCSHLGIDVAWNLLYGFPGEHEDDARQQVALIPDLAHLQPPVGSGRIWMERHSPIFTEPDAFPSKWRRPEASLSQVYPASVDLDRAAFFFDYELENTLPDHAYEQLDKIVEAWIGQWKSPQGRPALRWWRTPGLLQIEDARDLDEPGTYTFEDPLASLYLACADRPVKAEAARSALGWDHPVDEVRDALEEFVDRGLMMRDGNLFLALAIPAAGASM
jgi:ribosomal peptide maturation radical SAM protein 1